MIEQVGQQGISISSLVDYKTSLTLLIQALVNANEPVSDRHIKARHLHLVESLAGIVFLGCPHAGSGYTTLGRLICHLNYWLGSNTMLLDYLDPNSPMTRKLEDDFLSGYKDLRTVDFYEGYPIYILGFRASLVCFSEINSLCESTF